jgi:hypothetical protein
MSDNGIVPRYPATIVMRQEELSALAEHDYYDVHMVKNHHRSIASGRSMQIRLTAAEAGIKAMGSQMMGDVRALHNKRERIVEGLSKANAAENQVIDFGEQVVAAISTSLLKMLQAATEVMVAEAGMDIRTGIPEPPGEQPIIVQQGPQMRPSEGIRDLGKPKFVLDDGRR